MSVIGADLIGDTLYLAWDHPSGVQMDQVPAAQLPALSARHQVRLNIPLERLSIRYQPSDAPMDHRILKEVALANLGTPYWGFLEGEEGERRLYLLLGMGEPPGKVKPVPRFLSAIRVLEVEEGVVVWSDPVENFVLVVERGFPRQVRGVSTPEALPAEAGRAIGYLRTKGIEPRLYVREELAEAHAHLLPEEAIQIYEWDPGLLALGALTAPVELIPIQARGGPWNRSAALGLGLLLLALLLLGGEASWLWRLEREKRSLEVPYQEAQAVLAQKRELERRIKELERELAPWQAIQKNLDFPTLQVLLDLAQTSFGKAALTSLQLQARAGGIQGEVVGKTKDLPAYLKALQDQGLTLLEEAQFVHGEAEARVRFKAEPR